MKGNEALFKVLLAFLFISLLFAGHAFSQTESKGVEVKLTSPPLIETLPGKTVSGNFLIINQQDKEETLLEEIRLPKGWGLIIQEEGCFTVEPHGREIRVFGISIPSNSPPGLNEITYSIISEKYPSIKDEKSFTVKVLPLYKISLNIEEKPEKVVSGLTYSLRARVFNYGNLQAKVKLSIRVHPESPFNIEPSTILDIDAGSSRFFSVHVKTDEKINRKTHQAVRLSATVEGIEEKVTSEQSFSLEIIPRMVGKEDPYHRIPSTITLSGFYESDNRNKKLASQIEFIGSGTLDEKGEKRISFKFRGPEHKQGTYFNKDEYMLSFSTGGLRLHLGDGHYLLSPLLDSSGMRRGLKVNYELANGLSLKSYLSLPREKYDKLDKNIGGSLGYRFSEILETRLNLLKNDFDHQEDYLTSLQTDIKFEKKLRLELEGGLSKGKGTEETRDEAWRFYLSGEPINRFKFFLKNYHLGSQFRGNITPGDYFSGGVTLPIYERITGELSLSKLKENIKPKPDDGKNAENDEFSFIGGFILELPIKANISMHYRMFDRKDKLVPKNYDYRDELLRLGFHKELSFIGLNTYIEGGRTRDRLYSTTKDVINFGLSGTLKPALGQNYAIFFNHGRDYFSDENRKTTNIGIMGSWKLIKNLSLDISYFLNQRDFEKDTYTRHNLRSRTSYILPNNHLIHFGTNWIKNEDDGKAEFSVYTGYTIPFGIPVSKKKSVGTIKGIIYDDEDFKKPPLKDIIIMASGIPAVTDKNGKFVFPGLKPGDYFLQIERGSIGHDKTTSEKLEAVSVKGGELSKIDIGITRSGKITGRVEVFAPKKGFLIDETLSPEDYMPSGGLSDVLVEITRKNETLRQFTDSRGEFVFEDVRPGVWKVKIYEESLPAYHLLKEKELEIEIKPSEEKKIKFDVYKRPKRILIIEEEK